MCPRPRGRLVRRLLLALLATIAGSALLAAPAAQAAPPENGWTCRGQAVDVRHLAVDGLDTILGPVTGLLAAGTNDDACSDDSTPVDDLLDPALAVLGQLGLRLGDLGAQTSAETTLPTRQQTPKVVAGVADVDLGINLAGIDIASLLKIETVESEVTAQCAAGLPQFTSDYTVANVRVGGRTIADLTEPVEEVVSYLPGLIDVVVKLTPGETVQDGTDYTRRALRVEVLSRTLGIIGGGVETSLVDIALGESRLRATGNPCAEPDQPAVGAPTLDVRELTATVAPPAGASIERCSFTVTSTAAGSTPTTVPGEYDGTAGTCTATLDRNDFPPGPYTATASATTAGADPTTGTSASSNVTIAGPTVGAPTVTGRDVSVPVAPGAGATVADCTLTITPTGGGTPVPLAASYDAATGTCRATIPTDVAPGEYTLETTVVDSYGDTDDGSATIAVVAPTVGVPTIAERTATATVAPAAGTTIASCEFRLTPDGGGPTITVPGAFAAGACTASLPRATVSAGEYDIVVAATDSAGTTTTRAGTGTVAEPAVPVLVVGKPTIDGRDVSTPVTVPDGASVASCEVVVTPKGGGAAKTVAGTFAGGVCKANLPREDFPPGEYDVVTKVVDGEGRTAQGSGPVTVAGPTVGTPIGVGPVVVVPVTPGAGATVTECTLVITPVGGTPRTIVGTYDAATGTCSTVLPADGFPTGDYDVTATVKDSHGDTATNSGRVSVFQFGALPSGGGGGGSTTPPTAGDVAQSLLACEGGRLALIEARLTGSRVRVSGVALPALAGKRVLVRLSVKGKGLRTVARTTVRSDGQFASTSKAPSRADRRTTARAKYVAQIDSTRSGALRLTRRTTLTSVTTSGGRIRIRGRVSAPHPRAGTRVTVGQRVSCTSYKTVARTTTKRNGTFSVSFRATRGAAGLFRVDTRVPSKVGGPARSRTYSLPRIVTAR